jgi:hypothetical protein
MEQSDIVLAPTGPHLLKAGPRYTLVERTEEIVNC